MMKPQVLGISKHAQTASSIVVSFSAAGAIMSLTFAYVRGSSQVELHPRVAY